MSDWAVVTAAGIGIGPGTLLAWWSHQEVSRKTHQLRLADRVKSKPVVYDDHHTSHWCCC
jgi:hypothetical protein